MVTKIFNWRSIWTKNILSELNFSEEDYRKMSKTSRIVIALIANGLFLLFIFGLAHSISTGFAGFWGGLPFWIISLFVTIFALYDVFDETRKK